VWEEGEEETELFVSGPGGGGGRLPLKRNQNELGLVGRWIENSAFPYFPQRQSHVRS